MNETEERALRNAAKSLGWAATDEHAWNPPPFHVDGMHQRAERLVLDGIEDAVDSSADSPLGIVIQGEGGAGKTHLLGWVREQAARENGYFFLVDFSAGIDFWRRTANAMVGDLGRPVRPGEPAQAVVALTRLADLAGVSGRFKEITEQLTEPTREDLDALVAGLLARDRRLLRCKDTVRALALYAVASGPALDVGHDHLSSIDEAEEGDRQVWGMSKGVKSPQDITIELSTILSLTGPSVVAIDQIDALLEHSLKASSPAETDPEQRKDAIEEMAGGLMALRHTTRRTLCLVACLPTSWRLIQDRAVGTAQDRFRTSLILKTIETPEIARNIIARRLETAYAKTDFTPPHPLWPVAPEAFESAPGLTPRALLRRVNNHIESCRNEDAVRSLERFDPAGQVPVVTPPSPAEVVSEQALDRLDAYFAELRAKTEVAPVFDPAREDAQVPLLLFAALNTWIREQGDAGRVFSVDPPPGRMPTLHARLRQALDPESEEQRHWTFRMIGATNAVAALNRLTHGMEASGVGPDVPDRCFVVLRNQAWSDGAKTRERLAELRESGGRSLVLRDDDVRVFDALRRMAADADPDFEAWLLSRRPASGTELLSGLLGGAAEEVSPPTRTPDSVPPQSAPGKAPGPIQAQILPPALAQTLVPGLTPSAPAASPAPPAASPLPASPLPFAPPSAAPGTPGTPGAARGAATLITLGRRFDTGTDLRLDLAALARHTAVFAGSGSGKTVFLRRLVEECALQGVSSIVLDPNNDLARLGDPWPTAPAAWGEGDADRAERYFAGTEVVVWTPGRSLGRPLSFQPLPDFAAIGDDRDELHQALDLAVGALAPRAKVDKETAKATMSRAVLRQALHYFARSGGGDFSRFLALLAALPFEASQIDQADKLAAELGQLLTAATINDPLFAGRGEPVDPARLLTPSEGRKARVSVISFIGLNDDAKPGFVSQLQMALFSWIKRHPARDRPLTGLYVMDEAQSLVPATPKTEALASTLTLASQARKYGLGLVFATQAPRGLHNQIAGNATTQFIGRLNSPTQIAVVKDLARARGGRAERVGRLGTGEFYAASEGLTEALVRTPLCLSHHPSGPLTEQEILERSRL